jgi:two-component system chemotaxis response regulator CheB
MADWLVAVGGSGAEGLDDIRELLAALSPELPAIVMVVLHRPWNRRSDLQSILVRASALPVIVASQGERFEIGTVYIGNPAEHLTLAANTFGDLVDDRERVFAGRTVDLLFDSVAVHGGAHAVGVVLSGSLDDGARGLAAIHKAGGVSMVVTPAAFSRQGMPENAIGYDGPIDFIGEPKAIGRHINRLCTVH